MISVLSVIGDHLFRMVSACFHQYVSLQLCILCGGILKHCRYAVASLRFPNHVFFLSYRVVLGMPSAALVLSGACRGAVRILCDSCVVRVHVL